MFNYETVSIASNIANVPAGKVTVLPPATREDYIARCADEDGSTVQVRFNLIHVPSKKYNIDREHLVAGVGKNAIARMGNPEFDF